jgi:hypothetical protein
VNLRDGILYPFTRLAKNSTFSRQAPPPSGERSASQRNESEAISVKLQRIGALRIARRNDPHVLDGAVHKKALTLGTKWA